MQTESRTYRKDHTLALPMAKPGAKAGRAGEGEEAGEIEKTRDS